MNYDDRLKAANISFKRNREHDMLYKPKPVLYTYYHKYVNFRYLIQKNILFVV